MKTLVNLWQHKAYAVMTILFMLPPLLASAQTGAINGPLQVCEGDVVTYTYPYTSGNIYNWGVTGGTGIATINTGNNTAVFTVTWGLAGGGPYTVSVQELAGGTPVSNSTINVTVNDAPDPLIVSDFDSDCVTDSIPREGQSHSRPPSECETVCEDSPVNYTTNLVSGNTYQWTVLGTYTSISGATTNSATVTWGAPGNAFVIVTETTPEGCTQTDTVCINIVEKPRSRFKVNQGGSPVYSMPSGTPYNSIDVCLNSTVCFVDGSVGGTTWFWNFGNGNTSIQQNPCETYTVAGSYLVMQVVENECHCTDTSYLEVNVTNEEGPEIVCQNVICDNGTFVYDAILPTPCTGGWYEWTISTNGTITNANGTVSTMLPQYVDGTDVTSIEINWGSGPIGSIGLRVQGCGTVCDQIVSVDIPIIPSVLNISGDDVVCVGETGYYEVPCFPGTEYTWKVNGVTQSSNENTLWHTFYSTGTYTVDVSYNNSFLNCFGAANTFTVEVLDPFSISGVDKVCEGSTALISGPSGSQLNWEVKNQGGTVVATGGTSSSYTVPGSLSPGTYSVIAEDVSSPRDYCNDYAVHGLTVIPQPPAPSLINGPIEVCVGEVSIYTASPVSNEYYLRWEVDNGGSVTTSNGNSVTVTWNTGVKTITLYHVSKVSDCPSLGYTIAINDKTLPPVTITGPATVCGNTNAIFPEIYSTSAALDGYDWSISPANAGSVVSGQGTSSISVIWNNYSGAANVILTPVLCNTPQTAVSYPVNVTTPTMSISGPSVVCQNSSNAWTASFNIGTGTGYTWQIEEITTGNVIASGTGNPATYNFPSNSGSFVISISATNCAMVHTVTQNITVNPAPVANLTYSGNIGCISQYNATMFVSVQGTGPYSYDWYKNSAFDGNHGTSHSIGMNSADAGTYTVVITDANGCTATTNPVVVQDNCIPPTSCVSTGNWVNFTHYVYTNHPSPGCNTVRFQENIFGGSPSLTWYFANLGSTTGSMPTFTFPASGVYPVTLVASYGAGLCDTSYSFDVVVPVVSDYELNISCAGNVFNVDLINTSDVVHGPLSNFNHNWQVFDITAGVMAGTSTAQDFLSVPGIIEGHQYQVTLNESLVYSWGGQTINANCTFVDVFTMPFKADADFLVSQNVVCEGNPLVFTDQSAGDIVSWFWDFTDGSTILTQHPQKTYTTPGVYAVDLGVVDAYGCTDTYSTNVDVKANNLSGNLVVSPMQPMCPGVTATIGLNNTTSPSSAPYTYSWSNGSSASFITTTQTSTHYLALTDTYGCAASFGPATVEVVEIPDAIIIGEDEYCVGDNIGLVCNYGPAYNYEWFEFLAGTAGFQPSGVTGTTFDLSNAPVGTHQFKVELEEPISGCTKESFIFTVVVHPNPAAPIITTNPSPACPNSPVQLTVVNSGLYNHIAWSTGDVATSTFANTSGVYYAVGTDANGCSNYSTTPVYELPDFCSFMCGCYSDCIEPGGTYNFPGILGSYSFWRWEQWNGSSWVTVSTGSGTVSDFVATAAGTYTIRLYVVTYNGCDGYSCETDLVLVPCSEPCEDGYADVKWVKCNYAPDGTVLYEFGMDISFAPFGIDCEFYSYTIVPPFGTVQSSPSTINPGFNSIYGRWLTGLPYYAGGQVCFDVIIMNLCDSSTCTITVCFDVPECGKPPRIKGSTEIDNVNAGAGEIRFYPNPTSGLLKIAIPEGGNYQMNIFDMSGKAVFSNTINLDEGRTIEFNLQDLPVGPYSVQFIGNNMIKTERLIMMKE